LSPGRPAARPAWRRPPGSGGTGSAHRRPGRPRSRITSGAQPRALATAERKAILDALHSSRFADLAPDEVWATLLDEGSYLGSVSTYYRVLREAGESRERRAQATHPAAVKPELVGTGPNQVYSWTSPSSTARRNGPTTIST
jgi:hypothetical protein